MEVDSLDSSWSVLLQKMYSKLGKFVLKFFLPNLIVFEIGKRLSFLEA